MNNSLIRRKQLHPDVSGLVGLYGSGFFLSLENTGIFASQNQLNNTGNYLLGLITSNVAGVSSLNNITGAIDLEGLNGINVYESGNQIFFEYTGGGGFVENVVYTTGDQSISGSKTFVNDVGFDSQAEAIFGGEGKIGYNNLFNGFYLFNDNNEIGISIQSGRLYNAILGNSSTLDWINEILSGNWSTNTNPTNNQHIINKGYFDSGIQTLSNDYSSFTLTGGLNQYNIDVTKNHSYLKLTITGNSTGDIALLPKINTHSIKVLLDFANTGLLSSVINIKNGSLTGVNLVMVTGDFISFKSSFEFVSNNNVWEYWG